MKAIIFAVLAGLCWGIGELCTKSVLSSGKVGPMTVLLVRTAVALPPAVLAYWLAMSVLKTEPTGWLRAETPVMVKLLLGSALGAGFGGVLLFYLGLANGQVSVVKPIAFTVGPAAAVLLSWLVLKEPMNAPKAIGVGLVLAGIVLIAGFGGGHASPPAGQPPASAEPGR